MSNVRDVTKRAGVAPITVSRCFDGSGYCFEEMYVRLPEDIAVVSFDDLPSSMVIFPFQTVAVQPAYEMGKKAVEVLLNKLSNGPSEHCQEVVFPVEIVVRQSSGRLSGVNSLAVLPKIFMTSE